MDSEFPAKWGVCMFGRSMSCLFVFCMAVSLVLFWLPVTHCIAGSNENAVAYLSWSPDSVVADLTEMPTGSTYLYVRLEGVEDLSGCEFEVIWSPSGSPLFGCYEFVSGQHPSGVGTNCGWLMRGAQIEGMNSNTDSSWVVAFASDESDSVCS